MIINCVCEGNVGARRAVPEKHRKSIRLEKFDYTQSGAYFVTVCSYEKFLFGEIKNRIMRLNDFGVIVYEEWNRTSENRKEIVLDQFIVMPNHVHGIIGIIDDIVGTARRAPTSERFGHPVSGSLPTIIRSFKSAVTKRINEIRETPGAPVWQRNYYEHIVRNEDDLNDVRQYVIYNPAMWAKDENNI